MRKVKLNNENYYHVYNRGTEKRTIFLNARDYDRFLYLLYACNDTSPLENSQFYYRGLASIVTRERKPLVNIICFCLMPNHFHLILEQKLEGGISMFMQKLGTGYTMYFNTKYRRSGALFQGTFKAIRVDADSYLTHLINYIHLNPAELKEPKWKEDGIRDVKKTYAFVKNYAWSSYGDYLGQKRFALLLNLDFAKKLFPSSRQQETFTQEWLAQDLKLLDGLTFE